MRRVARSLTVQAFARAPPETVWDVLAAHPPRYASAPWFGDGPDPVLKKTSMMNGAANVRTGAKRELKYAGGTIRESFTAWDPPRSMAWSIVADSLDVTALSKNFILLEEKSGGTTITWFMEPRPANFLARIKFWLSREEGYRRMMTDSLANVVRYSEAAAPRPRLQRTAMT